MHLTRTIRPQFSASVWGRCQYSIARILGSCRFVAAIPISEADDYGTDPYVDLFLEDHPLLPPTRVLHNKLYYIFHVDSYESVYGLLISNYRRCCLWSGSGTEASVRKVSNSCYFILSQPIAGLTSTGSWAVCSRISGEIICYENFSPTGRKVLPHGKIPCGKEKFPYG